MPNDAITIIAHVSDASDVVSFVVQPALSLAFFSVDLENWLIKGRAHMTGCTNPLLTVGAICQWPLST